MTLRSGPEPAFPDPETLQQTILERIPVMLLVLDREGRPLWANRCWHEILGWTVEEAREEDFLRTVDPDAPKRRRVIDLRRAADGEWGDFRATARDGRVLETSWVSIALPGRRRIVVGIDHGAGRPAAPGRGEEEDVRAALEASLAEVRRLNRHLSEDEERESRERSRRLHDVLGEDLTRLSLNLGILRRSLDEDAGEARRFVTDSLEIVERLGTRVQEVMEELRPPMLDDYGLAPTLRWLGKRFARRTGITTRVRANTPEPTLPRMAQATLVRVTQEALSNVSSHASAANVWISLHPASDGVRLTITDDGTGFEAGNDAISQHGGGWGILGMRERVEGLGGTLRIESSPGRGTRLITELPW